MSRYGAYVWADGYGRWFARVPVEGRKTARYRAHVAIREELVERNLIGKGYRLSVVPVKVDGSMITYGEREDRVAP